MGDFQHKQRRHIGLLILGYLVLAGSALYTGYLKHQPYVRMKAALSELNRAIEDYAADHSGHYPEEVDALFEELSIGDRDNPFGRGKIQLLKPGEPWQPGGIVYFGAGPPLGLAPNSAEARRMERGESPEYVNIYYLLAYGPKTGWNRQQLRDLVYENNSLNDIQSEAIRTITPLTEANAIENVSWDHVVLLATEGTVGELYRGRNPAN